MRCPEHATGSAKRAGMVRYIPAVILLNFLNKCLKGGINVRRDVAFRPPSSAGIKGGDDGVLAGLSYGV